MPSKRARSRYAFRLPQVLPATRADKLVQFEPTRAPKTFHEVGIWFAKDVAPPPNHAGAAKNSSSLVIAAAAQTETNVWAISSSNRSVGARSYFCVRAFPETDLAADRMNISVVSFPRPVHR
jgi:hypothetical protein